jgi:hypothetical protein
MNDSLPANVLFAPKSLKKEQKSVSIAGRMWLGNNDLS